MIARFVALFSVVALVVALSQPIALAKPPAQPGKTPDSLSVPSVETEKDMSPEKKTDEKPSIADLLIDPEDGALDVSAFLRTARGFLPIGTVITEPAIGYGGGLSLLFLHDSIENRAEAVRQKNADGSSIHLPPPSMTGVAGFGTENGSWGSGAFHMQVFKDDRFRYLGGLFYAEMDLDYYGRGGELLLPIDHVAYTLEGYYLIQQVAYRVPDSSLFVGANYKYMTYDTKLDLGLGITPPSWFPSLEKTLSSGGTGLFVEYDSRNSIFTPDSGINAKFESDFYNDLFGSDRTFKKSYLNVRGWVPLHESWVLGLRTDVNFSSGNVPFYMLPSVNLRGISRTRYQGDHTMTSEAELRWDVTRRWSLIGFFGSGWVAEDSVGDFSFDEGNIAGGVGFRYYISKLFGIRTGMDAAWSEDDYAIYFTTGTAWGQ